MGDTMLKNIACNDHIQAACNNTAFDEKSGESSVNNSDNNNDNNADMSNDQEDNDEKTNLIVNYLPQQMTDEQFEDLFKKFGSMKSCKIVRNRVSGYSYGFGFVDFETHEQAIKAINELNGHELETKKIKVAFARPAGQDIKQANLYIKNVPNEWNQDDVKKVFEPYGNIIQVRVLGNNRGVAFVLFDLRKQAEDALEALNGKTVDGCEAPFEIKFAADKKVDKSSNKVSASKGSSSGRSRERGNRAGRNHNFNRTRDQQRQQTGQKGYLDRQGNHDDRQQQNMRSGQGQFNSVPYGAGAQYNPGNYNSMNGVGPIRQAPVNRVMNRYAPFVPIQQPIAPVPTAAPLAPAQMATNPAYGFPSQQQMIPFAMMPTQPMAPIQPINQPGHMPQQPMNIYGTTQMPMGYAPVTQNAMNNIYSVASNNMNNAANMQPQIGQPMTTRNNMNSSSGGGDDGVTLFVYNIGPDADDNELRSMFAPYGHVVKCNVVRKTPGGETKGFGFVTLRDRDQANSAISGLNGSMRNGRALQVSLKK